MKATISKKLILLVAGFVLAHCGSGSPVEDPTSDDPSDNGSGRLLTGSVPSDDDAGISTLYAEESGSCLCDTVSATNSSGETVTADIADDCSFSLILQLGEAYTVSFSLRDGSTVSLTFDTGSGDSTTSTLLVGPGDADIDCGRIAISGHSAIPEHQPLEQNDADVDGVYDFVDDDDNNDGIPDISEADCDLDGCWDIYDYDTSACQDDNENGIPDLVEEQCEMADSFEDHESAMSACHPEGMSGYDTETQEGGQDEAEEAQTQTEEQPAEHEGDDGNHDEGEHEQPPSSGDWTTRAN